MLAQRLFGKPTDLRAARSVGGLWPFVFFISLLISLPASSQTWDARLTAVTGDVTVFVPGEDPEGLPARKDMPLEAGDRIATSDDSSAEISFEGQSVISLRANSDFTLESARRSDSALSLALGALLAKIQSLAGGGLSVKTPTAIAAVRGTEFAVEIAADNAGETRVGVFDEGKVDVRGEAGGAGELVTANQETKVTKGMPPTHPSLLMRLGKYRDQVRSLRKRARALSKSWKPMSAEERKAARGKLLASMKELKQKAKDKRDEKKKKERRLQEQKRANREKMEKAREDVRRRLGR